VLREITKACGRSVAALKASVGILPSQLHSLSKSPSLQFSQSSVFSVFSCLSLQLSQSSVVSVFCCLSLLLPQSSAASVFCCLSLLPINSLPNALLPTDQPPSQVIFRQGVTDTDSADRADNGLFQGELTAVEASTSVGILPIRSLMGSLFIPLTSPQEPFCR
jgi:hypothetical protein